MDRFSSLTTASTTDYYLDCPSDQRLFLLYTLRCNYRCAHCLVSSGPERRETMALAQALEIIDAAADTDYRVIYLTGGEVFLYYRDLQQLVRRIRERGCASVVESNAYWATSVPLGRRKLVPLVEAGLDCIAISVDVFHLEFTRLETIINAARAASELELPCRVLVVASGDEARDASIRDELDGAGISYFYDGMMTVGRGERYAAHPENLQRGRCDSIGTNVLPSGDVVSCTGASDGLHAKEQLPLWSGNLNREPVRVVLARDRANPLARAIDAVGHAYLEELLDDEPRPRHLPMLGGSLCSYCHRLLGDPTRVTRLRERLGATAMGAAR
jgi:hypothetical protein